jgi:hypothetical protein
MPKTFLKVIYGVVAGILGMIFVGIIFWRFTSLGSRAAFWATQHLSGKGAEEKLLFKKVEELALFLKRGEPEKIYLLFNSSFQNEIPYDTFLEKYNAWRKNRRVKTIRYTYFKRLGRIAHVSSMIRFDNRQENYCYQSWILSNNGWKLVWLTNFLPRELLKYGESRRYELLTIKQLALKELFAHQKIKTITGNLPLPKTILIKGSQNYSRSYYNLPDFIIKEMTLPTIKAQVSKSDVFYYLDFATVRIIDDVASVYIDIVPLQANIPKFNRRRGMQLFFINKGSEKNPEWKYEGIGAIW